MIPKIIHYCWLSNEPIPAKLQKCIDSWKRYMPDWQIIRWSTENFDIHSVPFVEQAYNAKKWAFAADYIRIFALNNRGGVYLDSDVMLYGSLEPLLTADFVSAIEYHPSFEEVKLNKELNTLDKSHKRIGKGMKVYGVGIQAALIASIPNHPLLQDILNFYEHTSLEEILSNRLTAPTVIAYHCERFGFRYTDEEQNLSASIRLYSTKIIGNYDQKCKTSVAIHQCAGSWTNKTLKNRITKRLSTYSIYKKMVFMFKSMFRR